MFYVIEFYQMVVSRSASGAPGGAPGRLRNRKEGRIAVLFAEFVKAVAGQAVDIGLVLVAAGLAEFIGCKAVGHAGEPSFGVGELEDACHGEVNNLAPGSHYGAVILLLELEHGIVGDYGVGVGVEVPHAVVVFAPARTDQGMVGWVKASQVVSPAKRGES